MLDEIAYARQRQTMRDMFGFSAELLVDQVVARAAAAGQSYAGPMFPPAGPGMARWMHAVAFIGEATASLGYRRCDADLISKVRNDERGIAIVPAAGNYLTGVPASQVRGHLPKTKWPKGDKTGAAIDVNVQLDMFGRQASTQVDEVVTYMLLMHATKFEIRAELSQPAGRDSRGYVNAWGPRFLLPAFPFETNEPDLPFEDETGTVFEINVDPR